MLREKSSVSSRRVVFFFNPDRTAATALSSGRPAGQHNLRDRKLWVCVNIFSIATLNGPSMRGKRRRPLRRHWRWD
jgi:hypothetical protein